MLFSCLYRRETDLELEKEYGLQLITKASIILGRDKRMGGHDYIITCALYGRSSLSLESKNRKL